MKYILTCGCSFTKIGFFDPTKIKSDFKQEKNNYNPRFFKWTDWLEIELGDGYRVLNLGSQTNDNTTIARTIMYWLNELLSSGINSKDISVIIQWSTPQRTNFFIPNEKIDNRHERKYYGHTSFYQKNMNLYDSGVFYLTGGFNLQEASQKFNIRDLLEEYILYYNKDIVNQTLTWLENWSLLKLTFDKYGIKNHYFSMQDILSTSTEQIGFGFYAGYKEHEFERLVLDEKLIKDTSNDECWLLKNDLFNPYLKTIDMFENFWLYKTPTHKFGGQLEWTIQKYDKEDLRKYQNYVNEKLDITIYEECYQTNINERDYLKSGRWYGHTSSILNRKFVVEELIPFIKY